MPTPTPSVLFNSTSPAAPADDQNVIPQTDGATPLASVSFFPQRATSLLRGTVKPDGTTIVVDGAGTISTSGGGGSGGFGGGEAVFTPPVLASFTQDNFGASTTASTLANGAILLTDPGPGTNTNNLRSLLVAIPTPASPWTLTARIRMISPLIHFNLMGLVIKDGAGGKLLVYGFSGDLGLQTTRFNSASSFASVAGVGSISVWTLGQDAWLQWQYDGTNLLYQFSSDGNYFVALASESLTLFLAANPNFAGITIGPNNAGNPLMTTAMECFSFTLTQP